MKVEESMRKILENPNNGFQAGAFKDKEERERNFCFVSVFSERERENGGEIRWHFNLQFITLCTL